MNIHDYDNLANEVWGLLCDITWDEAKGKSLDDCVGFRRTHCLKGRLPRGVLFTVARDTTPAAHEYLHSDKMYREVSRRMGHLRYHALLAKGVLEETTGTLQTDEGSPALYLNRRAKL